MQSTHEFVLEFGKKHGLSTEELLVWLCEYIDGSEVTYTDLRDYAEGTADELHQTLGDYVGLPEDDEDLSDTQRTGDALQFQFASVSDLEKGAPIPEEQAIHNWTELWRAFRPDLDGYYTHAQQASEIAVAQKALNNDLFVQCVNNVFVSLYGWGVHIWSDLAFCILQFPFNLDVYLLACESVDKLTTNLDA